MTKLRACLLLAAFTGIALGTVFLRLEQTREASRALRAELAQVAVRRELWGLQAGVARLRTPDRIRTRIEHFKTALVPPGAHEPTSGIHKFASNQPRE